MRLEILWTCACGESFLVAVVVVVIVIVVVVVVVVVSRLPLQDFQSQSSNLKFCSLISRDGNHKTIARCLRSIQSNKTPFVDKTPNYPYFLVRFRSYFHGICPP